MLTSVLSLLRFVDLYFVSLIDREIIIVSLSMSAQDGFQPIK